MINYVLYQNNNDSSKAYGKWYARAVSGGDMVDLNALAKHMEQHNSGFSKAMCLGVMTAMVNCIKEMVLDGKRVKIDNLAIFSCTLVNSRLGAKTEEEFNANENILGVKLHARSTGTLSNAQLALDASYQKATVVPAKKKTKTDSTSTTGSGTGSGSGSGSGSGTTPIVEPGN